MSTVRRFTRVTPVLVGALAVAAAGCARSARMTDEHAGHTETTRTSTSTTTSSTITTATGLPAGAADARARVDRSPRHGEWAMVRTPAGDSVRAWVVYPERSTKAPVVLVVHEIHGLMPKISCTTSTTGALLARSG